MRLIQTLLAATAMGLLVAGAGQAKTLVYCSEGSPEGFDPAPWTVGHHLRRRVAARSTTG